MPLVKGKSPEAFTHNIKSEMKAGRPMKQSLAIAYNMKRKAKKMATGGEMESGYESMPLEHDKHNMEAEDEDELAYAHGGDIVDRIMSKRKMYSEGGKVANGGDDDFEQMADSSPNNFDDLALRDDLESGNSGASDGDLLGDSQEDHDRNDIIARIMKQRSMKQRNPRPA